MCKKYLLIAMLVVGSASYSVSATSPTMKFEGTVVGVCSGVLDSAGDKKVLFGSGSASSEHIHILKLTSNERTNVILDVSPANPLVRFGVSGAQSASVYLKSKISSDAGYEIKDRFDNLEPKEEISIYLDTGGISENEFTQGAYSYVVTATIDCY
ncbi:hypothetical protein [Vibrio mimicus]|uniref:hypothetical protein n=1 Tax=Vibrio mimicus TaxID=674 RepID=UPI002FEF8B56